MPTTVYDKSATLAGTDDGGGNGTFNVREVIKAANLSSASGNQIRITVLFGTAAPTETPAVDEMWVGQAAATGHEYDFNGNQVRVKFSGGNTINGSAAGTVTSDFVTLGEAYDNTKNYVISFYPSSGKQCNLSTAVITNDDEFFDGGGGASNASTSVVTLGTTIASNTAFVTKIEIQAADALMSQIWM